MARSDVENEPSTSAWRPLRRPVFRALWIASLASQIGTLVHDVAAAWLLTSLSSSALMVALVQSASTLPLFVLALPAGVLADVADRRRVLLIAQAWMLLSTSALAWLTYRELVSSEILLLFTVLLGVAGALNAPAWHATLPELVPQEELPDAIVLGGVAINLARTVGPGVGGLVIGAFGPAAAFALNAISFLAILSVLYRWEWDPTRSLRPVTSVRQSLLAGLRYARHAPGFRSVLVRTVAFLLPASALFALLPVVSRRGLELSAEGYGMLVGAVGLGALIGAAMLPTLRTRFENSWMTAVAAVVVGLCMAAIGRLDDPAALFGVLVVSGIGWLLILSSLKLGAQAVAVSWVRARSLSVFLFVKFASLAAGSAVFGFLADETSAGLALAVGGATTALGALLVPLFPLPERAEGALAPSLHSLAPFVRDGVARDLGFVRVRVEGSGDEMRREEALCLATGPKRRGLREGACGWGLFADSKESEQILELVCFPCWEPPLPQRGHGTESDSAFRNAHLELQSVGQGPVGSQRRSPEGWTR